MNHELEGWRRYGVVFGGGVAAAFVCSAAVPFLVASTGTIGPTALQAQSPLTALAAMIILFALAAGLSGLVGRYVNAAVGLFVLGAGLWALRLQSATAVDLAFAEGSLVLAAVETAMWGVLVLGGTAIVFRIAGRLTDILPADNSTATPWWKRHGLPGAACGVLVLPGVWLFARSPLQGHTPMAAVLGPMAGGRGGRVASPPAVPGVRVGLPCSHACSALCGSPPGARARVGRSWRWSGAGGRRGSSAGSSRRTRSRYCSSQCRVSSVPPAASLPR